MTIAMFVLGLLWLALFLCTQPGAWVPLDTLTVAMLLVCLPLAILAVVRFVMEVG